MKKLYLVKKDQQKGVVTLLTSAILIVALTLVTFLTAKTVLQETKMAANNVRAAQAISEAGAAMDYAITYFNHGGLDHDNNGSVDVIGLASAPGTSTIIFNNNDGTCTSASNMKSALITVTGTSDDGTASRSISQCVGTINIFSDDGPQQSLIARGGVGLTGNFKIVNRVNNTTVWSGNSVAIGNSNSAATYIWDHTQIRPDPTDPANRSIFEDITGTPPSNTDIISTKGLGVGVDIVDQDLNLSGLSGDELFEGFFPGGDGGSPTGREKMQALAKGAGQLIAATDIGELDGKDGIMWVDGDVNNNVAMSGGEYGSIDHPVALIINGNLNVAGNPVIYGVLYVTGQLNAAGTVKVIGSTIVEGTNNTSFLAGEDPVVGSGGVDLTYSPFTQHLSPNGITGTATVISGSWRDW
ncbi:MAG: hypothetical protein HON51_10455 [Gammaproteobacteria bacterium]|jgi:Tfp pilus assembly protein PilX|nr:hypothetical protein [Gammaproteobacteria bacterium]MBT5824975.1 hypothetical protein [Gammaproteobacteria bacterium]MBT6419321.1 hypothetical protein [Gammaproteobacteria bacterium]MBT6576623.1 hypothetical protein [Gammaproteobacteria bacterium]MBT7436602.1 hypothetical protein [Gammaproteobacteria bacterium]